MAITRAGAWQRVIYRNPLQANAGITLSTLSRSAKYGQSLSVPWVSYVGLPSCVKRQATRAGRHSL
jgi:hypothetical protein